MAGEWRIGLSKAGVSLLQASSWWRPTLTTVGQCVLPAQDAASPTAVTAALDGLLREAGRSYKRTRIIVGEPWVRSWMVSPPAQASLLADCRVAAAARFQTLYGEPLTAWESTADWQARQDFLAVALHSSLLAALKHLAADHRLVLLEITPLFVAAWNRWRHAIKPQAWLGVVNDRTLTIGVPSGRRLGTLRRVPMPIAEATRDWLVQALRLEAMKLMLSMPAELQLCGEVPASWTQAEPDDGLTCSRLDAEVRLDGQVNAGAASSAVALAATGWR